MSSITNNFDDAVLDEADDTTPGETADSFMARFGLTTGSVTEEESKFTSSARWSSKTADRFWLADETYESLPPGFYRPQHDYNIGWMLRRQIVSVDNLITLPDSTGDSVVEEIELFWSRKAEYAEMGYLHKRGILLWGDPGSGKSSTIQKIVAKVIANGGLAIAAKEPDGTIAILQMVRKLEPNRPVVVLFEDFDDLIKKFGEFEYLSLLDGESQIDNVVFLATTNYPETLDKRIIDRPSRFDSVIFVGMPGADARRAYFRAKMPDMPDAELDTWVKLSKGFGIAGLKEMICGSRILGRPVEEVASKLEKMSQRKFTSDDARDKPDFGFGFLEKTEG